MGTMRRMDTLRVLKAIKKERERRLLTQAELARLAGLSRQRVNAVLLGRSKSRIAIRAMRDALGLTDATS